MRCCACSSGALAGVSNIVGWALLSLRGVCRKEERNEERKEGSSEETERRVGFCVEACGGFLASNGRCILFLYTRSFGCGVRWSAMRWLGLRLLTVQRKPIPLHGDDKASTRLPG